MKSIKELILDSDLVPQSIKDIIIDKENIHSVGISLQRPLKLLQFNIIQAHFQDPDGQYWYFDLTKRLWRPATKHDFHPMGLDTPAQIQPQKSEFKSVESAMRYCLTELFKYKATMTQKMINQWSSLKTKVQIEIHDDLLKDGPRTIAELERMIKLLDRMEIEVNPEMIQKLEKEFTVLDKADGDRLF
jgi:hypothetical protein